MKIGLCGTGKMGAAMVKRLLSLNENVTVWNRDAAKLAPLVEAGAKQAASPAALVAESDIIITILLNAPAQEAVYASANGVLSADLKGKILIDMSTVLPENQESLSVRVAAKGGAFIECPVGGTVGPAASGQLFGFVGGKNEDVARAKPLLEKLCRRIEHVGPVGSGAKLKLAVNLPLLVYWQALGEALALCGPLDVTPARLMDILADTAGSPNAVKHRGPDIAKALAGEAYGPSAFDVTAARKDLATMAAFGKILNVPMPVTSAALSGFDEAIAAGLGEADATSLSVMWAKRGKK